MKTKIVFCQFIVIFASALLVSCSINDENFYDAKVYIVGGNDITEEITPNSVLWINDDIVELFPNPSVVNSVYVDGEDVYTAGCELDDHWVGNPYAALWKNGNITILSQSISCAFDVFVRGKVYVVGYESNSNNFFATLWIDGVATRLSVANSYAYSVYVSRGNVYVVGIIKNSNSDYNAVVWVNGIQTVLSTLPSSAHSVFVKNDNVYIAGKEDGQAILWVNGVATTLSTNYSIARSVFVTNNNTVYVAGDNNNIATLWKDGVSTALSTNYANARGATGYSSAKDIFVVRNKVYVAGIASELLDHRCGFPMLWIDGEEQILPTEDITRFIDPFNFYITGLFVK